MRQSLNLRKTARGRPQRWQREYRRVLKRCDLACLTTSDFLATFPSFCGEWQAEPPQERQRRLVAFGRSGNRDVETPDLSDVVVVDLGEDDLLADAERVVTAAVERARIEPAEVANARQSHRDESVEELVHACSAQRHPGADGHALAQLEGRNRFTRAPHLRMLAGDDGQLFDRRVEHLHVGLGFANAHVERDLRQPGHLHDRAQAQLFLELWAKLALVALLDPRRRYVGFFRAHLSSSWPHSSRRHTRTLRISP